jgi:hypothetical protein
MKRKPPKNTVKPAIRCAQDLADVPYQALRLPNDGRKWQALCWTRRAVLQRLAIAANQNGASISLSVERIANAIGISRATAFRRLDDLRALGFMQDGELNPRYHCTRVRRIDVTRVLETAKTCKASVADSQLTRLKLAVHPSQTPPDPTEVHTEVTDRRENRGTSQNNTAQDDSHVSEQNTVESSAEPGGSEAIPAVEYRIFVALLRDAGLYGHRDPRRDDGALRKLWNMIGGSSDERHQKMREALLNGIDQAEARGDGIETALFWAEMSIEQPEVIW